MQKMWCRKQLPLIILIPVIQLSFSGLLGGYILEYNPSSEELFFFFVYLLLSNKDRTTYRTNSKLKTPTQSSPLLNPTACIMNTDEL